ncbi:MAG: sialate O-acetylesterase, partial [Kiritimatiellales bacterium]|nr:sialate O-acetylesterase [Kiritimatiellales bacterium]
MRTKFLLFISFLSGLCFAAELSLPTVFSDHMVLQRDQTVPVWGKADPRATVTVEFAGQTKKATANGDGKWRVDFDPMPASAKPRELKVSANQKSGIENQTFSDVLVGEVWLCSGQSNMEMVLTSASDGRKDASKANYPSLRLYKTPKVASTVPIDDIDASWTPCTPETVVSFSGVAFYFGLKIQQDLDVPVGLLLSSWGGTAIDPWIPLCGFEGLNSLRYVRQKAEALANQSSAKYTSPSALYNGMIHAHIPFAIRGVIWYQGESSRKDGMLYLDKTKAQLNGWRKLWGYDFP